MVGPAKNSHLVFQILNIPNEEITCEVVTVRNRRESKRINQPVASFSLFVKFSRVQMPCDTWTLSAYIILLTLLQVFLL